MSEKTQGTNSTKLVTILGLVAALMIINALVLPLLDKHAQVGLETSAVQSCLSGVVGSCNS